MYRSILRRYSRRYGVHQVNTILILNLSTNVNKEEYKSNKCITKLLIRQCDSALPQNNEFEKTRSHITINRADFHILLNDNYDCCQLVRSSDDIYRVLWK